MTLGIECLLTDDPARAAELASALDAINRQRREVEDGMREQAEALMARMGSVGAAPPPSPVTPSDGGAATAVEAALDNAALALFDPSFHEGVVGILAGRLKDRLNRPVFVFAPGQDGLIKGSGRSIEGFHLRDALDLISKRHPDLIVRFGGHAMAAGCTLRGEGHATFAQALQAVALEWIDPAMLRRRLRTDGALPAECYRPDVVQLIESQVWGQGFEAPLFRERMSVLNQRVVGSGHLKLRVRPAQDSRAAPREAIWFNRSEPVADEVMLAYRLGINEWQGRMEAQMVVVAVG